MGRSTPQQDRWEYYLFATFEVLKPGIFADDVWLDPDGDNVRVLWSDSGDVS